MPCVDRGSVWIVDLGLAAKVRPRLVLSVPTDPHDRVLASTPHHKRPWHSLRSCGSSQVSPRQRRFRRPAIGFRTTSQAREKTRRSPSRSVGPRRAGRPTLVEPVTGLPQRFLRFLRSLLFNLPPPFRRAICTCTNVPNTLPLLRTQLFPNLVAPPNSRGCPPSRSCFTFGLIRVSSVVNSSFFRVFGAFRGPSLIWLRPLGRAVFIRGKYRLAPTRNLKPAASLISRLRMAST
jgi:hypothetical protein